MKKDVLMVWDSEINSELFLGSAFSFIADENIADLYRYINKRIPGEHYDN